MTYNIESLIKNDFEFISNYSEYQKLNIDINNKIIKLKDKLININNSKNILLNSLLQNKDKSKKMLKFYFSYIYYEKKKLNKILNKCIKQKQKYKKHNINKYNKFINSIEKIILLSFSGASSNTLFSVVKSAAFLGFLPRFCLGSTTIEFTTFFTI